MPISLSEPQFLAVANAAAALCPPDRDQFYAAVAAELAGRPIGDGSVFCAIRAAQLRFPHPEIEKVPPRWDRATPGFDKASKDAA